MSLTLRLSNLPWTLTRHSLAKFLSHQLNGRVRYTRVIYDKNTGLSRGVGMVAMQDEKLTNALLKRGSIEIDGRNVIVQIRGRVDENASSNA